MLLLTLRSRGYQYETSKQRNRASDSLPTWQLGSADWAASPSWYSLNWWYWQCGLQTGAALCHDMYIRKELLDSEARLWLWLETSCKLDRTSGKVQELQNELRIWGDACWIRVARYDSKLEVISALHYGKRNFPFPVDSPLLFPSSCSPVAFYCSRTGNISESTKREIGKVANDLVCEPTQILRIFLPLKITGALLIEIIRLVSDDWGRHVSNIRGCSLKNQSKFEKNENGTV